MSNETVLRCYDTVIDRMAKALDLERSQRMPMVAFVMTCWGVDPDEINRALLARDKYPQGSSYFDRGLYYYRTDAQFRSAYRIIVERSPVTNPNN